MYKPKDVFTRDNMLRYVMHIINTREALNYLVDHHDDLALYTLDEKYMDAVYTLLELIDSNILIDGDGVDPDE